MPQHSQNGTSQDASLGVGPVRRVLFFGKNMSRSRCTGGLVHALRRHGPEVRWVNMATARRWTGKEYSLRRARRLFRSFAPDLVFVFCRDLPQPLLAEFRKTTRVVLWVEEPLDDLDQGMIDYMKLAHLVCVSNPAHREELEAAGVPRVAFLMSGFSTRYHVPQKDRTPARDIVYIGGPGRDGQRAEFLAQVSEHFDTEIFGVNPAWVPWQRKYPQLRVGKAVDNVRFRRLCATSRIVLGINKVNNDPLYFSNRTFLTLACRGFHITHYVPGLETVFEQGEHLVWYRDTDECLEQIARYLPDAAERDRISQRGHDLVVAEHQYYHRVGRILELLGARVPVGVCAPVRPSPIRCVTDAVASVLPPASS